MPLALAPLLAVPLAVALVRPPSAPPTPAPLESYADGFAAWYEPDFQQRYTWTGDDHVVVFEQVRDEATGAWNGREYAVHCPFDVTGVASGGRDLYCVTGVAPDGERVFELLELEPWKGLSWTRTYERAAKVVERREVFRAPFPGDVLDLDLDPRGRFAFFLAEEGGRRTLYRLTIANGAVEPMADSDRYPELAWMDLLQKFAHTELGRVWWLSPHPLKKREPGAERPPDVRVLFVDGDDSGTFDGQPIIGDGRELNAEMFLDLDPLRGPLR